jgi:hypothetical protein
VFESTRSTGSALPAGRWAPSVRECQELWATTPKGVTDWFAAYDPQLGTDADIVEIIADLLDEPAQPAGSATNSTSNPSSFSRYVA